MRQDSTVILSSLVAAAFISLAAQASDGRWVRVGDLSGHDIAESVWCDATADGGAGAVDVVDGATGGLIVRFTGEPGAQFGAALAEVGDINGDGLADLLVGAPGQQRACFIDSPFADVAEQIVPTTRLNFVLSPPTGTATTNFGSDVAGIHDLDGDEVPDLRVAAVVVDSSGTVSSQSFVFQSITGALIGIGRRAGVTISLEVAEGDTDRDVCVDSSDMLKVVEQLGAPAPNGATDGDVTLDGAVDGADVGLVLQTLGTRLYAPIAIDPGTCATGTYAVQALEETLCVEVIATSTLAAEITIGIGQAGPFNPADIIHPFPNECGEKIAACLADSRVIAAAQLVRTRCWPTGTPGTVIGKIYCSPCKEPGEEGAGAITLPWCDGPRDRRVDVYLCDRATDPCLTLAHELFHVSQACSIGLFNPQQGCEELRRVWEDPQSTLCGELEAYHGTMDCRGTDPRDCCAQACGSAFSSWRTRLGGCEACCQEMVARGCCVEGMHRPGCPTGTNGPCNAGGTNGD